MLTTLLYHRIGTPNSLTSLQLEKHFIYIKKRYPIVFPGDSKGVCITFDDATVDFYINVYPLLKKHQIPVILAAPSFYILDKTAIPFEERLSFKKENLFTPFAKDRGYFCTFKELKEMQDSSLVKIASHSHSHPNLLLSDIDLHKEIVGSKDLLEEKLEAPIETFVYPYGKFNAQIRKLTEKHYTTQMRIGSGINFHTQEMLYRIPCDALKDISSIFSARKFFKHSLNYLFNKIRMR